MPAKSEKQAIAARIARGIQKGEVQPKAGTASAEMAKMKPSSLKHFTKTEAKGSENMSNSSGLQKLVKLLAKKVEDFQNYVGVDAPYDATFDTLEQEIADINNPKIKKFWNNLSEKQQTAIYNMVKQYLYNKALKQDPDYYEGDKPQAINYNLPKKTKMASPAPTGDKLNKVIQHLANKTEEWKNYEGLDSPDEITYVDLNFVVDDPQTSPAVKKFWYSLNRGKQDQIFNKVIDVLHKKYGSDNDDMYESIKLSNMAKGMLEEARKKKILKKEADEKKPEEDVADELPQLGGEDETNKQTPPAPENPPAKDAKVAGLGDVNPAEQGKDAGKNQETPNTDTGDEASDVEKVKADAVKAKAELEKAKAEKDQAEKEIEQQAHVKLVSKAGVSFLLSKLLGDAVEKNSLDALAGEMVDKLKIQNTEDFEIFSNEMTPFKAMPGVAQLLSSIKTLSSSQPQGTETEK